ncbi:putative 6-oxocamphor hydrolase [Georgfuchsia toluolica]|uniref:6-oxocamphor hydrolase n=1 Tax=Georgfuchsia toluolica TaxID=424218 RepID=A0A916J4Y8_9PROT|nr:enoyl-CoA hydratase/isomerase family protein [Georgfuchsia toluolica]CAG4884764.1 putative 6-oxocamphor hydrolase [Georgfuchsia toluolica]
MGIHEESKKLGFDFVKDEPFESYRERFKDHFVMTRKNGIIEVRMHNKGEGAIWGFELHKALPQMFQAVGADRDNEVMILTGTGDYWLREFSKESFTKQESNEDTFRKTNYDLWFLDGLKLQENMLWSIDIPIITVINGPGFHTEFALLADLTICADDARFVDIHWGIGLVPGDASLLVFQQLIGLKRANWASYMVEGVDAKQALEWGLVNEVHSREKLLPRAWEIAGIMMKQDRVVRGLTTQLMRRPWKRLFTDDFAHHFAHELYAANVCRGKHNSDACKEAVDRTK